MATPILKLIMGKYSFPLPISTAFSVCKSDRNTIDGDRARKRPTAVCRSAKLKLLNSTRIINGAKVKHDKANGRDTANVNAIVLTALRFLSDLSFAELYCSMCKERRI